MTGRENALIQCTLGDLHVGDTFHYATPHASPIGPTETIADLSGKPDSDGGVYPAGSIGLTGILHGSHPLPVAPVWSASTTVHRYRRPHEKRAAAPEPVAPDESSPAPPAKKWWDPRQWR